MDSDYQSWIEFKKTCKKVYPSLGAKMEVCVKRNQEIVLSNFGTTTMETVALEHDCEMELCTERKKGK